MTGPFPVVGISAEFADAFRRSAYQADIFITFIDENQVLVAFEHR
jgi:hypothetical protein